LGFADVDLIEGKKANVGALVLLEGDGLQVDVENLGLFAVGDMGPHHVDIVRSRPGRDPAHALEEIQNRFLTAIGHGALHADALAKEQDMLAFELGDLRLDVVGGQAGRLGDAGHDLRHRSFFNPQLSQDTKINAAVRANHFHAREVGAAVDDDLQYIGTAYLIVFGYPAISHRGSGIGLDGVGNRGARRGAAHDHTKTHAQGPGEVPG